MHITNILKGPILTEKSYKQIEDKVYTFKVNPHANKTQIKHAFETIFEVKVINVNICNLKPKKKRMGKFEGLTRKGKKAIITLAPGENLDLFNENSSKKSKKK